MIEYHLAYSRKPYLCYSLRDAYVTVACRTDFAFAQSEVRYCGRRADYEITKTWVSEEDAYGVER